MKRFVCSLCVLALAMAASAKASSVVYDNSGPGSFTTTGWTINSGFSVADSFNLSSSATIDAISFGDVLFPGDTLDSVAWEITTEPNGGITLGSGTATSFSNVSEGTLFGFYPTNDSTFGISSLSLAAGTTYYLEFSNAVTAQAQPTYWDESDNPNSTPYQYLDGSFYQTPNGSETFALSGGNSAVPEPSGLLLLGSGLAGLALIG